MIRLLLISFSLPLLFCNCCNLSNMNLTTKKISIDGREMLYGNIDREQLYFDYPDWEQIEKEYKPSSEIVDQIKKYIDSVSVDIFLGTWCSDSKREVPVFFKIIDQADITNKININVWALDRSKKLDNGFTEKCNIEYVPTFIFYKSKHEIGRIVEMPAGLFEEDILKIIQSSS